MGIVPGLIKATWVHIAVYVNAMSFCLVAITAYYTTIEPVIHLPFVAFVFIIATVIISAMILEYKYIMPSTFRFNFDQFITHSTLFKEWMNKLNDKMDNIEHLVSTDNNCHKKGFKYHRRIYQRKVVI